MFDCTGVCGGQYELNEYCIDSDNDNLINIDDSEIFCEAEIEQGYLLCDEYDVDADDTFFCESNLIDSLNDCCEDDIDDCDICDGNNQSCIQGCTDEYASNYYCDIFVCENDTLPSEFLDDGSCIYNISGNILYYYPIDLPKYIEGVLVTLIAIHIDTSLNTVWTDTTKEDGKFEIKNIPLGYESYALASTFTDTTLVGIDNFDAYLISDVMIGNNSFNEINSYFAADVNLNGRVNSYDASVIMRYIDGTLTAMNETEKTWIFLNSDGIPELYYIDDLNEVNLNNNIFIHGVKLGDPSGNWMD